MADNKKSAPTVREWLTRRPENRDLAAQIIKARIEAQLFQSPQTAIRIGRFVLLDRIGIGAMGEVYTAYDSHLDRKVAIKLVNAGTDEHPETASKRLLREAQILGQISHPNVVYVHEAGTVQGRVFVAMELIHGKTLRAWLNEQAEAHPRGHWRTVLSKFLQAGRGLQAVHAAGLIHRDFKPDNVLIANDDGRVRVADFGLARAYTNTPISLDATWPQVPQADAAVRFDTASGEFPLHDIPLTATGALVGTPAYMAPEQMCGQTCDSRSDQFSFCVALHEGLYGERPFTGNSVEALQAEIQRGIAAPPRQSGVPTRIWKVLARGMAFDPADRFADMGALLAALSADPTQRWARWGLVGLAVAGLATGVFLTVRSGAQSQPICAAAGSEIAAVWNNDVRERARAAFARTGVSYAAAAWERAERQLAIYAGDWQAESRDVCEAHHVRHTQLADMFQARAHCLASRQRRLRVLLDELVRADARTVENAVQAVAALPWIAVCRDFDRQQNGLLPPDNPVAAAHIESVRERLAVARTRQLLGRPDEAMRIAQAQLAAAASLAYEPVRAEALFEVGRLWHRRSTAEDVRRAEALLGEAVDVAESHGHDQLAADVWIELVLLASRSHSDMKQGHRWARRAEAASQRIQESRRYARAVHKRGQLYFREGRYAEAERHHRKAVTISERQGGNGLDLADYLHDWANALKKQDRFEDARDAFERALQHFRDLLGAGHPRIASLHHDFGKFLQQIGEFKRARAYIERAIATWMDVYGPNYLDLGKAFLTLAELTHEVGDLDQAEAFALRGRDIFATVLDRDHGTHAAAETSLGLIYFRGRRFAEALAAFRRALEIQRRTLGDEHVLVGLTHSNISETLVQLARYDEALVDIDAATRIFAQTDAPSLYHALVLKSRGQALLGQGRLPAAINALEAALALFDRQPGSPLERADIEWTLARALRAAGNEPDTRVRALAQQALQRYTNQGRGGEFQRRAIEAWLAE